MGFEPLLLPCSIVLPRYGHDVKASAFVSHKFRQHDCLGSLLLAVGIKIDPALVAELPKTGLLADYLIQYFFDS